MIDLKKIGKAKQNKIWSWLWLVIILLLMSLISAVSNNRNLSEGISFFLFQICGILLPGLALLSILFVKEMTGVEQLLLGYGLGYCLNIGMYFIVMGLELKAYIKIIFFLLTIISVIVLYRKNTEFCYVPWKEKINLTLIIGILFGYMLIVFSKKWGLPLEQKGYHQDLLFWIGDAIALKEEFVPINFRTLAAGYKYHYFGAIQMAVASMVTEMTTYSMAVFYSYIESVIFMALSCYCIVRRCISNKKIVFLTLFFMFFTTGIEMETLVTQIWHLYLVPMSFNIALSIELIIIMLILIQYEKQELEKNLIIFCGIFILVATGMKGPVGAIALCIIGFFCIYWLFVKKEVVKPVLYGGVSLIAFGIVFFGLLADTNKNYTISDTQPATIDAEAVEEAVILEDINVERVNEVKAVLSKVKETLKGYATYYIKINPWTFVPAALLIIMMFIRRRIEIREFIFFVVIIIGTFLGYIISYVGNSQMYFTLSVFPIAALLAGILYQEIDSYLEKEISIRIVHTLIIYVFIACQIWIGRKCTLEWEYQKRSSIAWNEGFNGEQQYYYGRDIMTVTEYNAYEWVRENIENDSIILSDRALEENEFCYIPGVFSEHHIYYYLGEDWEKGKKLYSGNNECLEYFNEKNIEYILVTKRISPDFKYDKLIYKKVYGNSDIDIYMVLK